MKLMADTNVKIVLAAYSVLFKFDTNKVITIGGTGNSFLKPFFKRNSDNKFCARRYVFWVDSVIVFDSKLNSPGTNSEAFFRLAEGLAVLLPIEPML